MSLQHTPDDPCVAVRHVLAERADLPCTRLLHGVLEVNVLSHTHLGEGGQGHMDVGYATREVRGQVASTRLLHGVLEVNVLSHTHLERGGEARGSWA